ncbi:MAG: hypothetical protein Q9227_005188 [Pyrenula ochraceoflavens]
MAPKFALQELHLGSPMGITILLGICTASAVLYNLTIAIYNIYFHPLSKFPGPKLWAASYWPRDLHPCFGTLDSNILKFFKKHGPVIRISPTELTFIDEAAWRDIYGHGHAQMEKDPRFFRTTSDVLPANDLIRANDADHTRARRQVAHAFSEKALREQEPIIKGFVDLLIQRLRELNARNEIPDMVRWYNFTTFDVIGDLALNHPFSCLQSSSYHLTVTRVFESIRSGQWTRLLVVYPHLSRLIKLFIPSKIIANRKNHFDFTRSVAEARIEKGMGSNKVDFLSYVLKNQGRDGALSHEEMIANVNLFLSAGSETTATLLSGVTYHLVRNPHCLARATTEIRTAFPREEDITFASATAKLPYTLACLNEAFRMYPPVPTSLPRLTPRTGGLSSKIAGHDVPPGTSVSVHQLACYTSPYNFTSPTTYDPTRWLEPVTSPNSPSEKTSSNNTDRLLSTRTLLLNSRGDKISSLQPFSTGPRNCIGRNLAYNEMRLILARVLWNFDLLGVDEERSGEWDRQKTFLLWEKKGLFVRMRDVRRGGGAVECAEKGVQNGGLVEVRG